MKILFVLENYWPHVGGVERIFKNLCEGLVEKGYKVGVITHRLEGTKRFETVKGVKIYRVSCLDNRYLFTFFSFFKVLKFAKKVDIIHTTTYNGAPPAWLVATLLKKPIIITIHEVLGDFWYSELNKVSAFFHRFFEKLILSLKYDRYVCVSESTQRNLLKINKKINSVVIYNGFDYDLFNPAEYEKGIIRKKYGLERNFLYLFYGRPGITKGVEYLIKAVPEISKKIPDSKLILILSKDKQYKKRYDYIINLIKELKIEENIVLVDPVPYEELPLYLMDADCVVIPSLTEGFGYSTVEACAMGKIVIASDTTSIPEVISGKYELVEPKKPEAIARGVYGAFNGHYLKTPLKKFTIEENVKKYLRLYHGLIQ